MGRNRAAKAICRKMLKQAPDNFNAQHLYGVLVLKEQQSELADRALTVATQMQASDKYLAQAWNNLALTRIYDQRLSDAWDAASKAIELDAVKPLRWIHRTQKPLPVWQSPCASKSRLKRQQH